MSSEDLLQQLKRKARRVCRRQMLVEANRQRFEALGLELEDIERMAAAVDLDAMDLLMMETNVGGLGKVAPLGSPGRRESTRDIAIFAHERRLKMVTWKQILDDWKAWYPHDERVTKLDDLREAHRRFFGDKVRKAKNAPGRRAKKFPEFN